MNEPVCFYRRVSVLSNLLALALVIYITVSLYVEFGTTFWVAGLLGVSVIISDFIWHFKRREVPILTLAQDYILFNDRSEKIFWSDIKTIKVRSGNMHPRLGLRSRALIIVYENKSENLFSQEISIELNLLDSPDYVLKEIEKYKEIKKSF